MRCEGALAARSIEHVDDPRSMSALIAFLVIAWQFARAERILEMRSQSTFEQLIDEIQSSGKRFFSNSHRKHLVTLALGFGRILFSFAATAVAFIIAHETVATGVISVPAPVIYAGAALGCLLPLTWINIILSDATFESPKPATLRIVIPILVAWTLFLWPVVSLIDRILEHISRTEDKEAREEALKAFVEEETEDGVIEEETREMINSLISIDEIAVKEIMIPRVDVVAINRTKTMRELATVFAETRHSRIPVYEDRVDNIIGVIYVKDSLDLMVSQPGIDPDTATVETMMRDKSSLLFVPTTNKVDDLLREFRREKKHMAIAVDEYGGVAGLVTMENVLEEIVGDIQDEYDDEKEESWVWINDQQVLVDAGMDIADVNELLDANLPDEEGYETLGGFLYHQFSAVPQAGAVTMFDSIRMIVQKIDAQRITRVMIEMPEGFEKPDSSSSKTNGSRTSNGRGQRKRSTSAEE
jgi:magnesium and cobalt exporter, CNNM family